MVALGFSEAARCCGDGHFQNTSNFIIAFIKEGREGGKKKSTWAELFLNKVFGSFHQPSLGSHCFQLGVEHCIVLPALSPLGGVSPCLGTAVNRGGSRRMAFNDLTVVGMMNEGN